MRIGRRRHLITIKQKSEVEDSYGGTVYAWTEYAQAWAKIRPLRGKEVVEAMASQSDATVAFYTRYISGVNTAMRIVHGSNYYDITSVADVNGLNKELEIFAKVGTSGV